MRIVFMGTPDFAEASLKKLIDEKFDVVGVFTQPDKPKGRGMELSFSPVKELALASGLPVYQPVKMRDGTAYEEIKALSPDILVVVAYGRILPDEILALPKYGAVNVHGSLLPKYRGAAPIQWSIIHGREYGGVTTMYMAKGLDSGDMILKAQEKIRDDDTYGSLYDRLSVIGADLLIKTLRLIERGEAQRTPQNDAEATTAPMITREMERINWNDRADNIVNLIKGLNPQPVAHTLLKGEKLKIWFAEKEGNRYTGTSGEIVDVRKKDFVVMTADGAVAVKEVQAQGGKKMTTDAYMRGHAIDKGTILE